MEGPLKQMQQAYSDLETKTALFSHVFAPNQVVSDVQVLNLVHTSQGASKDYLAIGLLQLNEKLYNQDLYHS